MGETFFGTWVKQYPPGVTTKFLDGTGSYDQITLTTDVTGVLPVANGGTNSSTALNNNRLVKTSAGAIVEFDAITNGQLPIGSTGASPVAAALTAGTGISITNGAGSITIATTNSTAETGCDVYHDATQSVNDVTDTALVFNTETRDTDAFHSTSSNTGRITIPTSLGGWYLFGAHVPWTGSSVGVRKVWFRTNGTTASTPVTMDLSLGDFNHEIVQPLYLAAGDYVEVLVHQANGAALNVLANARFWALKMGGTASAPIIENCRVTLETAVGVSTSDQTAKTTVYLTPWMGNLVTLMNSTGVLQAPRTLAEISIAVPATTLTLYYLYLYDSSGTLTLEASTTAFAVDAALPYKSGDKTRLYVGQFRTTGTSGQTESSRQKRFAVSAWNQVPLSLHVCPAYSNDSATTSYSHTSTVWAEVNAGTNTKCEFLVALTGGMYDLTAHIWGTSPASQYLIGGLGIDSTTSAVVESDAITISTGPFAYIRYTDNIAAGYHFGTLLALVSSGTGTIFADNIRRGATADPKLTWLQGWVMG